MVDLDGEDIIIEKPRMSRKREQEINRGINSAVSFVPKTLAVELKAELDAMRTSVKRLLRICEDAERIIESRTGKNSWIGSSVIREERERNELT